MKVDKTLARFAAHPDDPTEMRRMARALGSELPRERLEVLKRFRAGLARTQVPRESYAAGYVSAVLDVAAEYETHVRTETDADTQRSLAAREEVRSVLVELRAGAEIPAVLASRLAIDPVHLIEILDALQTAGLVQPYASGGHDQHMRPYRLTLRGEQVLDRVLASVSPEVEAGIRVAVGMFRYLSTHDSSPMSALREIAEEVLHDPDAAAVAAARWTDESRQASLITEAPPPVGASRAPEESLYRVSNPVTQSDAYRDDLWRHAPSLLAELGARHDEQVPVYVRTSASGWSAWAYALQSQDNTGLSRTILDGDLLLQAVSPPDRRFDLIYDSRATFDADRNQPAMRELMEQANERFFVTLAEDDVPEGFEPLAPHSSRELESN